MLSSVEDYPPNSQISLRACCSLWMTEASWTFLWSLCHEYWHCLIQPMFGQTCWWDFMDTASDIPKRCSITENSLQLPFFPPLLCLIIFPYMQECLSCSFFLVKLLSHPLDQCLYSRCLQQQRKVQSLLNGQSDFPTPSVLVIPGIVMCERVLTIEVSRTD